MAGVESAAGQESMETVHHEVAHTGMDHCFRKDEVGAHAPEAQRREIEGEPDSGEDLIEEVRCAACEAAVLEDVADSGMEDRCTAGVGIAGIAVGAVVLMVGPGLAVKMATQVVVASSSVAVPEQHVYLAERWMPARPAMLLWIPRQAAVRLVLVRLVLAHPVLAHHQDRFEQAADSLLAAAASGSDEATSSAA